MNKYNKLVSNTAILAAGTFGSKLLVFLLMPLYTRILSSDQYGLADLIAQTANFIIPLASVGICDGLFRFALESEGADRRRVFSTGICILAAGSAAVLCLVPLLGFVSYFRGYIWLIALYVIAANFHSACAQYIRAQGRTTMFAVQGILNTLLTIALNILFLVCFDMGTTGYVLSVVVADSLTTVFVFLTAKLWRDFSFSGFDRAEASKMLRFSLPYIPTTMLWLITNVSDRYIVTYFCGQEINGLYAAAYKIPTFLTLVCGVFIEAWQFSAVKDEEPQKRSEFFGNVYKSYMSIIFIGASGLILTSKLFTKLLLADSYYSSWQYVPVLVMATVFSTLVSFMGSVYFLEKRSLLSMLTSLCGAVINIVLNFVMIPDHGAMGAAVATLISYLVVYIVRAYDTQRFVRFKTHTALIVVNTLLIACQTIVMISAVRHWRVISCILFAAVFAVNAAGLVKAVRTAAGGVIGMIKRKK